MQYNTDRLLTEFSHGTTKAGLRIPMVTTRVTYQFAQHAPIMIHDPRFPANDRVFIWT